MKDKTRLWDASLIAGGVLLTAITLQSYRRYDSPEGKPTRYKLSLREAESTASSIRSHVETKPEDFNAWARLGIASYYRGPEHYAEGLNAIDKARSLGATSETLFYYAGVMYEALGLPEYAVNELSKYLHHYPDDFEIQVRLANLYSKQGKADEALKQYELLTGKWPKDPVLWFNYGVIAKEKGDLDRASACFANVRSLSSDLPEGEHFQEGEVARLKGLLDEALVLYQKEIELHPQFLPAWVALESVQRKKSLWKEAKVSRDQIAVLKQPPAPPAQ